MKAYICTKQDWEYEVIDVFLVLENEGLKEERDIRGFDDFEWEEADKFAQLLAKTLSIEFVGDRTDT